jgi:molybdenum cofactor cytidylyltransferase
MKFGEVPIDQALGAILAHNHMGRDGHKKLGKGRVLTEKDLTILRDLGLQSVTVAQLDTTDLDENTAAQRVGNAITGQGLRITTPGVGRANIIATATGPLRVNVPALAQLNNIDPGITIATQYEHTLVHDGELVALVKIIPFGIPLARVRDVEAIAHDSAPILALRPLRPSSVALIISGPPTARDRLTEAFHAPVRQRIEALSSTLDSVTYTDHTPTAIADVICDQVAKPHDLILITSVSAIIDDEDVVPTALRRAGGNVAHFGTPVDPGSLLMLGYIDDVPVLGAPGCVRSLKTNVIDRVLPRLLAGERLTRADLVAMGHGGLLDDISDRPMPRHQEDS